MWSPTDCEQVNSPGSVPTTSTGTTLIIDDRADGAYPDPDVYVDQASTIRVGQTLDDVEGIMAYGFSAYRYVCVLSFDERVARVVMLRRQLGIGSTNERRR